VINDTILSASPNWKLMTLPVMCFGIQSQAADASPSTTC